VLSPEVAACVQNVLRGVVTDGTGTGAAVGGHTVFGKTGTTDAQGDAWYIGATPQLATAVWFGNWRKVEGGAGFGGASAAPVFQAFMSQALANEPDVPLPDPGPVCARAGQQMIDTGGRTNNAPVLPGPSQLPTVQQQPTTPAPATPATPTAPAPTPPTSPVINVPSPGRGNGQ
jgi:membrane peptidoglycan carboxypeptidase